MPIYSENSNNLPASYLGLTTKITANLFEDRPISVIPNGMTDCANDECRYSISNDCYVNDVFASSYSDSVLKNDKTSFLFIYPFTTTAEYTNWYLAQFWLQRYTDGVGWSNVGIITGSTYGTYYDFQSLAFDNYKGVTIHWQNVLDAHGQGIYRLYTSSTIYGTTTCEVSPPYRLREFNCTIANKTVRFESYITGKIGRIRNTAESGVKDYAGENGLIDLTDINWYSSIRMPGFFGKEKTEYDRMTIEYENGQQVKVRDEAIQKYEFISGRLPKYVHDQFKIYFLMSDRLMVSDYNFNNADYFINQKEIYADGNYEPNHNLHSRLSTVTVQFKDRFQNVIKKYC